jgi:phosphoglycerol transferase MdoB-like AlkP superfamily enzyme
MRRFRLSILFLLCAHVLGLLFTSLFRGVEYVALHGAMSAAQTEAQPWGAFLRGVWFDNVVGCYILTVPLLVLMVAACCNRFERGWRRFVQWWYVVLYTLILAISASNIPYYAYFAKNINSSIFNWFGYANTTAGMVVGESSYWLYIALFVVAVAAFAWCVLWLRRHFDALIAQASQVALTGKSICWRIAATLCLAGLCVFGIRGRVGYNPIKVSEAYYSQDPFLNQLGISPTFNLLTSWMDDMRPENRELHLMAYDDAITYVRQQLDIQGVVDSADVLKRHVAADSIQRRPNIVIILMESMSASFLHSLGQREEVTPTLDSLYHCSWAFTNCYSAGIHTNHGMTASLYSFPALMKRNLMKGTVTPRRHGLPSVLKQLGYHNMFFMTHESQYDNMNAFFRTNGYDAVYAQEDYPMSERVNAFGVSDHFLFKYGLQRINEADKQQKPWMATLLTVSNHPPYVIPDWFKPKSKDEEMQIVEYADWCIGDFLAKARREKWYDNTLFVIMADHGKIVGQVDSELPESYNHIPLIIFGPGVEPRLSDQLAMQVDVMPTVLGLLGAEYDFDGFGVNLLTTQREMVFYTADDQVAARDKGGRFVYLPATGQSFKEGKPTTSHEALKKYVFGMIQTAEYMMRRQHDE